MKSLPFLPLLALLAIPAFTAFACSDPGRGEDPHSAGSSASLPPDDTNGGGGRPEPIDLQPDGPWDAPVETGAVAFPYTAYRCGYAIRQVSPAKPATTFHAAVAGSAPAPKNLHLTLPGNAATSVAFGWATDKDTTQTEVRFGTSPSQLDSVAHGFSFLSGSRRQHELHLCGLKPGTTYYYDAGGGAGGAAARSSVHKFTTAPAGATEVTLLVVGDTRTNPQTLGAMAATALAQGPTAMLISGDAVADGGSQSLWDALFGAAPDLFAEVPAMWSIGNHEGVSEIYFHQFALPDHGGGSTQVEEWYESTYGPVRAIVLNDTVSSASQITGSERDFLETSLRAVDRTKTPFVVTMHHKPMYTTSSAHSSDTGLRSAWGPLLAQYKVNADLSGHVHCYETTKPLVAGTTNVTTDLAGGTRFLTFGGGGAPLYDFSGAEAWDQLRESTNGFAILKVDATTMKWTGYRKDGSILESITMPVR